jgi:hypothetical protein
MKMRNKKLILLFCLCLSNICFAINAENLLPNSGFEKIKNRMPEGWKFEFGTGFSFGELERENVFAGQNAVKIACKEEGSSDWRVLETFLDIDPEKSYKASVQVYSTSKIEGSHYLELQWFGKDGYISRDRAVSKVVNKWDKVEIKGVKPPIGATHVAVLLRVYEPGDYYFDDIYFAVAK